jgi:hypothetical protein
MTFLISSQPKAWRLPWQTSAGSKRVDAIGCQEMGGRRALIAVDSEQADQIVAEERACLAGEPGFEPGLTESESVGLPLTYSPAAALTRKIAANHRRRRIGCLVAVAGK